MNIPKFRAWYKVNKKMYDVLTLDIIDKKVLIENNEDKEKPLRGYVKISEVEIMQSTGLKDKSGAEIFEGDIIDVGTTTPFIHRVEVDRQNAAFILIPIDSRWSKSYMYSFEDKSRYEVIGNIYENSELMERV